MTLLITPLKIELKYLRKGFEKRDLLLESFQVSSGDRKLSALRNKEKKLILVEGGHGKTQFGIKTQFWLQNLEGVEKIITLGTAGGLCPNTKPLDLLIAESIIEHDYHQFFTPSDQKPVFKMAPLLLKTSHLVDFKVHRGGLASGDEDVVTIERAESLFASTKAKAVAWESAGGIRAAQFNNIPYFEIRGITDNARDNVAEDFKKNLEIVMDRLAEFVLPLLD